MAARAPGMSLLLRASDWPLRVKAVVLLMLVSLLPLGVETWIDIREARERLVANAAELLSARGDDLADKLDAFHRVYQVSATALARLPLIVEYCRASPGESRRLQPSLDGVFDAHLGTDPHLRGVVLLDLTGRVEAATEAQLIGKDLSLYRHVREALQGRPVISDIHVVDSPSGEEPTIAYLAPVLGADGKPVAIAMLWVRADALWDIMRKGNELAGPGSFAVLFDRWGIRIGHSYSAEIVFHPGGRLAAATLDALVAEGRFGANTRQLLEDVRAFPQQFDRTLATRPGREIFRGFAPVNQKWNYGIARRLEAVPWTLFYMIPEQPLTAQIAAMTRRKTLFAGVILCSALLAGALFAAVILRPIGALSAATRLIAGGDLAARVEPSGGDELGQLGASFNAMAERIDVQTAALQGARDELEHRVLERTAELRQRSEDLEVQTAERERLAAIAESSDDAIISKDLHGVITSWNLAAERMFGYSAQEMVGKSMTVIIPADRMHEESSILARIIQGEVIDHFETVRVGKSGRSIDVSVTVSPIKDRDGRITGASKIARDITGRKRAEVALRASEERFQALELNSWDAVHLLSAEGVILYESPSVIRVLGYRPEELVGRNSFDLIHPDDLALAGERFAPLASTPGLTLTVEVRVRHKDGSWPWMDCVATNMLEHPAVRAIAVNYRDITEARRAKEVLRESEERFRTMANSITQLAWIAHADGYIHWYNRRWYDYTGTTPEQMAGWDWQSVHDPEVLPRVLERWKSAIDSGDPFEMEFPLRGADGRFRTFLTRVQPLKDAEGKVVQWFGTNTDVDELKRIADSLRDTQARLNSTLAAGSIGTWTWDIGNDSLVADEFTARAFSVDADAAAAGLPAAAYLAAVMQQDQPAVSAALALAIESCGPYDIEYRVPQPSGAYLWLQARGRVEGDAAGKAVSFHGAVMDITARKQAEAAMRESEAYFHFLNDLSEATRTLADPEQIMAVMARMLGVHLGASRCAYADVEPDGEQFTILHDYTDGCASTVGRYRLSLFGPRAVATLNAGQTLIIRDVDAELSAGEGAEMFSAIGIQAIITCPLVKAGVLRAMMAVHQSAPRDWQPGEITIVQDVVERCWTTIERRTAEEQIHHLNAALEDRVIERTAQLQAANKELEAFSYSVSHDLRAPLRAVDGFSQAVLEDYGPQLPPEGLRQLHTIRESAQRMGTLIDDLLMFARLSRLAANKQGIDTAALVRSVLHDLGAPWPERLVELRVGALPASSGDPALLRQVWQNLLSNALKYTSRRERAVVEVGCVQTNGVDTFFVRDNGAGFDMRYADKLFGVFQRLHRAEDYEGTGVGLAIVQRVVQRHGGRVWADAAVDRGATFYFTLQGDTAT